MTTLVTAVTIGWLVVLAIGAVIYLVPKKFNE